MGRRTAYPTAGGDGAGPGPRWPAVALAVIGGAARHLTGRRARAGDRAEMTAWTLAAVTGAAVLVGGVLAGSGSVARSAPARAGRTVPQPRRSSRSPPRVCRPLPDRTRRAVPRSARPRSTGRGVAAAGAVGGHPPVDRG